MGKQDRGAAREAVLAGALGGKKRPERRENSILPQMATSDLSSSLTQSRCHRSFHFPCPEPRLDLYKPLKLSLDQIINRDAN